MIKGIKSFYDREYIQGRYARSYKSVPTDHPQLYFVERFVTKYDLKDKCCLEIGAGAGAFQDMVPNYVGVDISEEVRRFFHKPFVVASANELPFADNSFDAVWSIETLEHIPNPERALTEMRRVLRNRGYLLLSPAWYCRPWAAKGYAVRPWADFDWRGKIIKLSIPVRNSLPWRVPRVFLWRFWRLVHFFLKRQPTSFQYRKLEPDYEHNWTSDSDAINSMDPFECILWFVSRGDFCLSHPTLVSAFMVRTGGVVFRICK